LSKSSPRNVRATLAEIVRHPVRQLVLRWNWKAALLSAAIRGVVFFSANLQAGGGVAAHVLLVDASYRIPLAGGCAAVVQAMRSARPLWAALLVVLVGVPVFSHSIEFIVHRAAGTPALGTSIEYSVGLSVASSAFELFVMRHGLLIVGPGAGSLADDLRSLPRLFARVDR